MCVKVNKIDQAKMNEILSLKFHTRTTIYKFKLYMCAALSFFRKKAKEKIPTKCWLGFNELFYILAMRRALLSDCTGSSM